MTGPGSNMAVIRQFPPIICSGFEPRVLARVIKSSPGLTTYLSQPAGGGQDVGVKANVTRAIGVGIPGRGVAVCSVPGKGVRLGGGRVERGVGEATERGTASSKPKPMAPITINPVAKAPIIPKTPLRSPFITCD